MGIAQLQRESAFEHNVPFQARTGCFGESPWRSICQRSMEPIVHAVERSGRRPKTPETCPTLPNHSKPRQIHSIPCPIHLGCNSTTKTFHRHDQPNALPDCLPLPTRVDFHPRQRASFGKQTLVTSTSLFVEKRNDLNRIQVNKSLSLKFNPQLFDVFKVHTFQRSVKRRKWDVDDRQVSSILLPSTFNKLILVLACLPP